MSFSLKVKNEVCKHIKINKQRSHSRIISNNEGKWYIIIY